MVPPPPQPKFLPTRGQAGARWGHAGGAGTAPARSTTVKSNPDRGGLLYDSQGDRSRTARAAVEQTRQKAPGRGLTKKPGPCLPTAFERAREQGITIGRGALNGISPRTRNVIIADTPGTFKYTPDNMVTGPSTADLAHRQLVGRGRRKRG